MTGFRTGCRLCGLILRQLKLDNAKSASVLCKTTVELTIDADDPNKLHCRLNSDPIKCAVMELGYGLTCRRQLSSSSIKIIPY